MSGGLLGAAGRRSGVALGSGSESIYESFSKDFLKEGEKELLVEDDDDKEEDCGNGNTSKKTDQ